MNRLEKMDDFFAARVDGYDGHMKANIEGAKAFYAFTASLLPEAAGSRVLDLGCGTGLELEEYFARNPGAEVTGIDLSGAMLEALKAKFPGKNLTTVCASYFDVPLGENRYDAAVSVESLHHFTPEMKLSLYRKLHAALKADGVFVLTDYFAESAEQEEALFRNLAAMKKEQGLPEGEFYHYDTPLLAEHEAELLRRAGFREARIVKRWSGCTCTVLAAV